MLVGNEWGKEASPEGDKPGLVAPGVAVDGGARKVEVLLQCKDKITDTKRKVSRLLWLWWVKVSLCSRADLYTSPHPQTLPSPDCMSTSPEKKSWAGEEQNLAQKPPALTQP